MTAVELPNARGQIQIVVEARVWSSPWGEIGDAATPTRRSF